MSLPNTHYGTEYISSLLDGKKKIFFAGIGGVSMCSLAHITHLRGHEVCGYDRTPSKSTKALEDEGIAVYYESDADHMKDVDLLVYTVAIPADNEFRPLRISRGLSRIPHERIREAHRGLRNARKEHNHVDALPRIFYRRARSDGELWRGHAR